MRKGILIVTKKIIIRLVVVDECHNILNIEKAYAAKWFVTLMSEARKYFTGIALATQQVCFLMQTMPKTKIQ